MSDFLIAAASAIAGIIASIAVSKYYFRRSVQKRLTAYLQYGARVFGGMDLDVRRELQIHYKGKEVDDLYELQFAVVNDGDRAIRDCIEPLTLHLRNALEVLDVTVLRVHPEGRVIGSPEVLSAADETTVRLPFVLLNRGEGFVVKMVLRGRIVQDDLRFTIAADDLPPVIEMQLMPSEDPEPDVAEYAFDLVPRLALPILAILSGYAAMVMLSIRPHIIGYPGYAVNVPVFRWVLVVWLFFAIVCFVVGAIRIGNVFIQRRRALNLSVRDRAGLPRWFWRAPQPYVFRTDIFDDYDESGDRKV